MNPNAKTIVTLSITYRFQIIGLRNQGLGLQIPSDVLENAVFHERFKPAPLYVTANNHCHLEPNKLQCARGQRPKASIPKEADLVSLVRSTKAEAKQVKK